MANHVRRQVREAIAALLVGLPTTGSRVYTNLVDPVPHDRCPALSVRNGAESLERRALGAPSPLQRRAQTYIVTVYVSAATTPWDTADECLKEVEAALFSTMPALNLGGKAVDMMPTGVYTPRISGEGERIVVALDMQIEVLINAREGIPDAVIG